MEGLRQGRHHHLGDPGDRLPVGGPGPARVRAPRLPARRRVFLVHLLADPGAVSLRPRRAGRDVPGGPGPAGRPGAGVGRYPGRSAAPPSLPSGPRQGRVGAGELGRGHRDDRGRARAHHQDLRAGSGCRLLADPGDVDGVVRGRFPVRRAARRGDDVVLRLVRRPAGGLAAGVRRPDRRAGVRGLVGRVVSDDVGLECSGHPHARRALDGRGPLPRNESRQRQPRLRRQHEVRRRVDAVCGRDRRGAGDGDGSRHPVGMLRAHNGFRSSSTTCGSTPICRSWSSWRNATVCWCPARTSPPPISARPTRERRVQAGAARRGDRHRRGAEGLAGIPLRRRRCGQVEPGSRRPGTGFDRRGARRADRAGSSAALRHRRRARRDAGTGCAGAAGRRTPRAARCST